VADLCTPRDCPCGKTADARGTHALSCRLAFGRMACHHESTIQFGGPCVRPTSHQSRNHRVWSQTTVNAPTAAR